MPRKNGLLSPRNDGSPDRRKQLKNLGPVLGSKCASVSSLEVSQQRREREEEEEEENNGSMSGKEEAAGEILADFANIEKQESEHSAQEAQLEP